MNWLLVVLVALPLGAAALLLAWRRAGDATATGLGTVVAAVTLAVAVAASVAAAPYGRTGPGLEVDIAWVPALGLRMHLGLDGVSAPLVLLTALLTLLVCGHLTRVRPDPASSRGSIRGLVACVLAVEGGALGTFMALDLLLFFIVFEVVLVPMWFIVAFWGDSHQTARSLPPEAARPGGEAARRDAAMRFILYTGLGSAVMLLGLLLVALRTRTTDLVVLAHRAGEGIPGSVQTTAAALILLGLAVKAPMWPLHTWLPPAHTIAPTGGSVLLAGVLLKMGTYGMVRIVVPVLPAGMHVLAPWLAVFGVIGILWGGLVCLVERDLKRLIATSSVAHMGFVLLGIASMTPQGLQGALFANVAHGLITGLLFLVVGALKDRYHTADLAALGRDLRDRLPRLGWLLAFGAIAGLGLPGLAGFWGELLCITGAWQGEAALGWLSRPLAVLAAFGTVLATAYLLRVLRSLWHGPRETRWAGMAIADVTGHEIAVASPLVAATMAVGLLPWLLLDVTGPSVRALLAGRGGDPVITEAAAAGLRGVPHLDWVALAPVILPVLGVVAILVLDVLRPGGERLVRLMDVVALVALGLAGVAVGWLFLRGGERTTACVSGQGVDLPGCSYAVSGLTLALQAVVVGGAVGCLLLALDGPGARDRSTHHMLMLTATAGALALAGARDLATLAVAFETSSLPVVGLVALRRDAQGAQAGVTLLLTAIGSLGLLLLGSAMLYAATGSLYLDRVATALATPGLDPRLAAVAGLGALVAAAGVAFKISAVPFHLWTPDTYAGAPLPVAAFLAVVSKSAGVAAVLVLLGVGLPSLAAGWAPVIGVLAVVTMTVGNLVAIRQRVAVRLLAWSTVAQAGWVLAPLAAARTGTPASVRAAVAASVGYLIAYAAASLAAFTVVVLLARHHPAGEEHTLDAYRGLARREPIGAFVLMFALACLAGLPPGVMGLVAKVVAVRPLVDSGAWAVAVIASVNVILGLVYYLRWAGLLVTRPATQPPTWRVTMAEGLVLGGAGAACVALSVAGQAIAGVVPGVVR